mgnify:CR=1 FL=1
MFKAMIALTRLDEHTHEQFVEWWTVQHAPLARQLPGVRRIVFNPVDDPGPGMADGVAELWFDSQEAFTAAYATDIGKQVAADSLAHVSSRVRMLVQEIEILPLA